MKFLALALSVVAVTAQAQTMADDDRAVVDAAVAKWEKKLSPGVTVHVAQERYPVRTSSFGIATFSSRLAESGATLEEMQAFVRSFFSRNDSKYPAAPFFGVNETGTSVRTIRVTRPGYDDTHTVALVAGGEDEGSIWLALVRKKGGVWRAAWTGTMKPMPPDVQLPSAASTTAPFRVGGDVKAPIVIKRVEPVYSAEARAAGITGVGILEAVIDKSGRVQDLRVLKPLPYGLDEAAIDAVKHWEFKPGTLNGEPVKVLHNLIVNFRLDKPTPGKQE